MLVMVLERAPTSLRGELTRWLIEPQAGVFVGSVSAMVRDRLWEKCCQRLKDGAAIQIWSSNNEQGFVARAWGLTDRELVDYEGLLLVRLPRKDKAG
jgi:CRISPR-associated protein Cas2